MPSARIHRWRALRRAAASSVEGRTSVILRRRLLRRLDGLALVAAPREWARAQGTKLLEDDKAIISIDV